MLTRSCNKRIDKIYRAEGFENQFEKTKKTWLELILSVQSFTLDPSKNKLLIVHDKVADYWILCKQIIRNAKRVELKHLVNLNKSFEKTMNDLELKNIYSNILQKHEIEIHFKLEKKAKNLTVEFKGNPHSLGFL